MCPPSPTAFDPENVVLPNEDRISRPVAGRFFPLTVAQVRGLVKNRLFGRPVHRKRFDLVCRNPASPNAGIQEVAAFWPGRTVLVSSFAIGVDPERAAAITKSALLLLADVARQSPPPSKSFLLPSFHAYFEEPGHLVISERFYPTNDSIRRDRHLGTADFLAARCAERKESDVRVVELGDSGAADGIENLARPLEWPTPASGALAGASPHRSSGEKP